MTAEPATHRTAFSYVRFSTPEQSKGDSLARQTEKAGDFCRRHGWTLDASLSFRDLGVSAFHGKNALVGNLGTFLDAVSRKLVPPGSALIVESVDRISRQGIDEGYEVCKRILKAGIHIVTLTPERDFGPEAVKSLSKGALELQLILERAAEESELKSERVGRAWATKRKHVHANQNQPPRKKDGRVTQVLTAQLPAWLEERGGKAVVIPARAAAVKRIFRLAADGYSQNAIVKKLTAEKVKPFGEHVIGAGHVRSARAGKWLRAYVAKLLRDRRLLGEFQPRGRDRKPDGAVILGYFPTVIGEQEWLLARAGVAQRDSFDRRTDGKPCPRCAKKREKQKKDGKKMAEGPCPHGFIGKRGGRQGRPGDMVNVFAGLLHNARDGGTYYCAKRPNKGHLLVNTAAGESGATSFTFPYEVFEREVLKRIREINPHDILNGDHPPDETTVLAAELAGVESELAEATAWMNANGFSATIAARITTLESRQRDIAFELNTARQKAATPLSESWGESQSLIDVLDKAPDQQDTRLRLRAALRRIIDSVWLVVVPRGHVRLARVQIWFAGGKKFRSYFIVHRRANDNGTTQRKAVSRCLYETHPDDKLGFLAEDLRRGDARQGDSPYAPADFDLGETGTVNEVIDQLQGYPVDLLEQLLDGTGTKPAKGKAGCRKK